MADIWTVSNWSLGDADLAEFVTAFRKFADVATASGGAAEGMILQETDDPTHVVVVRRWESAEGVAKWRREQGQHAGELLALVPEGGSAAVLTKVADLGIGGADPG